MFLQLSNPQYKRLAGYLLSRESCGKQQMPAAPTLTSQSSSTVCMCATGRASSGFRWIAMLGEIKPEIMTFIEVGAAFRKMHLDYL